MSYILCIIQIIPSYTLSKEKLYGSEYQQATFTSLCSGFVHTGILDCIAEQMVDLMDSFSYNTLASVFICTSTSICFYTFAWIFIILLTRGYHSAIVCIKVFIYTNTTENQAGLIIMAAIKHHTSIKIRYGCYSDTQHARKINTCP